MTSGSNKSGSYSIHLLQLCRVVAVLIDENLFAHSFENEVGTNFRNKVFAAFQRSGRNHLESKLLQHIESNSNAALIHSIECLVKYRKPDCRTTTSTLSFIHDMVELN